MTVQILNGDSLEILRAMPDNSVDSVVTDPPYGLGDEPDAVAMLADWVATGHHQPRSKKGFMGRDWDAFVPQPVLWAEVFRVLKPGGHVLAFAGTRTQDLMCLGLRLAGFEIRDLVAWVYGTGFPKNHDVAKALQAIHDTGSSSPTAQRKAAMGESYKASPHAGEPGYGRVGNFHDKNTGNPGLKVSCAEAQEWLGFGTALKPAIEPITLARKPLDGTIAQNVLRWRTGAINIDACRVASSEEIKTHAKSGSSGIYGQYNGMETQQSEGQKLGRWPAGLIHDGSDEVISLFPGDEEKSAARFFYCAKASKKDREEGLADFQPVKTNDGREVDCDNAYQRGATERKNPHQTVKPTELMAYLCRLITPPGGVILDPFMGSGSTGKAAVKEGFSFIGVDLDAEFCRVAEARIAAVMPVNPFAIAAE